MSTSVAVSLAVITATLVVATAVGMLINRRAGHVRAAPAKNSADVAEQSPDVGGLGLSSSGPTVVHFSAVWCGPCKAVRRVVDQVCADLPAVAHVEIDLDTNPDAARRLSVLSLPTTLIFDAGGRQRYRTTGVPKANDLRAALQSLLA